MSAPDLPTTTDDKPPRRWRDALAVYLQPRVLIVLFLGFSSGLPLALSGSTLLVWMREAGVDLKTIGLFALVGTPYTLKFLWAPLVDAMQVPLFTRAFGRRRGWLLFSQLLLIAAILLLALTDPARSPFYVALGALFYKTNNKNTDNTRTSAWRWGYVVLAAMVLIGTITALVATEPEQSMRAEAATQTQTALARVLHAAVGAFSEF